jgi:sensor histidine kinase YesM
MSASQADLNVIIKSMRIAGHSFDTNHHVNFLEHLDLNPDQHTLDIQFQALAFPRDQHVVYSYQVKGLHDRWIPLGKNNSVTLSQLPPGHYVFQVKAGEPNSSAPVKFFSFSIARPLFLQTWFLLLSALLLIGMILTVFRLRMHQIRRREKEKMNVQMQIAELELQVLRAQMNPHFMFNSLNSIKNYILKHETAKAAEYLSSFAHLIRLILQHSRERTISLQDELEMLLLYIDLEKLRFREGFEFIYEVNEEINTSHVQIPPMIIQPYIENAIWHGLLHKDQDRRLALRVSIDEKQVTCEIEDNGIGREQAAKIRSKSATRYKSMGMGITQDRITLMNSMSALGIRIDLIDKTNGAGHPSGTLVKIHIPHARYTD